MLLQLLIVFIEFTKLVWQDVGIWNEVKVLLSVPFLHSYHIEAQPIFPSDFVTLWEMIYLLVLVQALI